MKIFSLKSHFTNLNSFKKILILSSNPKTTPRLRLDEEVREIEEGLLRSKHRHQFDIQSKLAVRLRDLRRAILDYEPQIVHFAGHGIENGLLLEDELGFAAPISAKALSVLFELCSDHVECVILNSCFSAPQAVAISKHINYVIGMRKEISDKAAIEFAVAFYDSLGAGKTVEEAFQFGRAAILMAFPDIPGHLIPVLKKRKVSEKQDCETVKLKTIKKDAPLNIPKKIKHCKKKSKKGIQFIFLTTLLALLTGLAYLVIDKLGSDSEKLYVTNLSFIDGRTLSTMTHEILKKSIDDAILDGIKRAKEFNNCGYHFIMPNTSDNIEKLVLIIFDPDLTIKDRINKIVNDMMVPNKIDVIVSGFYMENSPNPLITVRPLVIIKDTKKMVSINFQFLRSELFIKDPLSNKKIICDNAYDQIYQAVHKLLEQFGPGDLCVKSIPFMDITTLSSIADEEEAESLHKVVLRGIWGSRNKKKLIVNNHNHSIENTDENVNSMINILFDPNLTGREKTRLIIKRMMNPNDVDVIVSGQYIEDFRDSSITIRVFIIIRGSKKIVTQNLQFERSQLFCPGQLHKDLILCDEVYDAIAKAVQELFTQL